MLECNNGRILVAQTSWRPGADEVPEISACYVISTVGEDLYGVAMDTIGFLQHPYQDFCCTLIVLFTWVPIIPCYMTILLFIYIPARLSLIGQALALLRNQPPTYRLPCGRLDPVHFPVPSLARLM